MSERVTTKTARHSADWIRHLADGPRGDRKSVSFPKVDRASLRRAADALVAVAEHRDRAELERDEADAEITRLRERVRELEASGRITPGDAAAAQEYVAALERDRDRINYMDGLTGEVSLIRWTGRRHGEIRGLGWVLLNEGPGVVSQDVSPTVRAAIDRARGVK